MGPATGHFKVKECNYKGMPYFEVWRCELGRGDDWKLKNKVYETRNRTRAAKFVELIKVSNDVLMEKGDYQPLYDGTRIILIDKRDKDAKKKV